LGQDRELPQIIERSKRTRMEAGRFPTLAIMRHRIPGMANHILHACQLASLDRRERIELRSFERSQVLEMPAIGFPCPKRLEKLSIQRGEHHNGPGIRSWVARGNPI